MPAHGSKVATHYKTLQHIASHCNTLQHSATHSNDNMPAKKRQTATHCNRTAKYQHSTTLGNERQAMCCNCTTLQQTAAHNSILQHTATQCSTLQHRNGSPLLQLHHTASHTIPHCNTLQHAATHSKDSPRCNSTRTGCWQRFQAP